MAHRDIVVVGASAGGVETLSRLVGILPPNLPASVFIVLHTMPGGHGLLPGILAKRSTLPVSHARSRSVFRQGHVYVAPPDWHLLLNEKGMVLSVGPTHNRNRPAIDPLFQSAARHYGSRVIGVLLTGFLDDGSQGMAEIQDNGGYTIVQDPADALVPAMPRNVLARIRPDAVVPLAEIGQLLNNVCREEIKESLMAQKENGEGRRTPTTITCPECHGVINQVGTGKDVSFECQVGHSFTASGLAEAQEDALERALWAGVRALEEGASLSRKMAEIATQKHRPHARTRYTERANQREEHARVLLDLLGKFERQERDIEIIENSA